MPAKLTPQTRKTKAQLIEEYNQLLANLDQARQTAREVHEPANQQLLTKAKQTASQPTEIEQTLTTLRTKMNQGVGSLSQLIIDQIKYLDELRQAADLMTKDLELHHNIKVSAATLDHLITEHELKKQQFALDEERQQAEQAAELAARQRDWEREQEDKSYQAKQKRKHEQQEFIEDMDLQTRALRDREDELKEQTRELEQLRQQVADIPQILEKKLNQQAKELTARLHNEHKIELDHLQQQHQAAQQILELSVNNLQDDIKRQQSTISSLKQESERANKRSQELAVTIIKSQHHETSAPKDVPTPPAKPVPSQLVT